MCSPTMVAADRLTNECGQTRGVVDTLSYPNWWEGSGTVRPTRSSLICQGGDVRAASLPGQVTAAEHCKDISTTFYAAHSVTVMFRKHFLRLIWFTDISSIAFLGLDSQHSNKPNCDLVDYLFLSREHGLLGQTCTTSVTPPNASLNAMPHPYLDGGNTIQMVCFHHPNVLHVNNLNENTDNSKA